jgi:hypothetical protein
MTGCAQLARPAKQRQSPCRHLRCQAADTPDPVSAEPVSAESLPSAVLAVADLGPLSWGCRPLFDNAKKLRALLTGLQDLT